MLDRLGDVPVVVVDPAWEIVALNPIARALIGEAGGNIARRVFSGEPSRFERSAEEQARLEAEAVADLHDALGRYPEDEAAAAAGRGPAARQPALRRAVGAAPGRGAGGRPQDAPRTPRRAGSPSTATSLTVQGSNLQLIVYTAPPGSPDADALALVAAIGLQTF